MGTKYLLIGVVWVLGAGGVAGEAWSRTLVQESVAETTAAESQEEATVAQQTVKDLPGYDRYSKLNRSRFSAGREGRVTRVQWSDDGSLFTFQADGKKVVVETDSGKQVEKEFPTPATPEAKPTPPIAPVGRAEQRQWAISPDGKWRAIYHEFNIFLEPYQAEAEPDDSPSPPGRRGNRAAAKKVIPGDDAVAVTTDGDVKTRYGTCCWVYGEELDQQDALWWSPDGKKLAFYEVAETHMKDYHLSVKNTEVYPSLETTRYPTAGEANPYVALLIYDLDSKETIRVSVEGPKDQYLYNIGFTADSKYLKLHRTNRWQNELDVLLADVATGKTRLLVQEKQETWQDNSPTLRFLEDGTKFIWQTERTGYFAYELRSLDGSRLHGLTPEDVDYPCGALLEVDEDAGWVYFSAFPGENPYNAQIFRSRLDGSEIQQLTDQELSFSGLEISPDHRYFLATGETASVAPKTFLFNAGNTQPVATIAEAQSSEETAGNNQPELFHFPSDDGEAEIWGVLYKPSNFDPNKKYPLVIDVYGGPNSSAFSNRYSVGNAACEFGFIIAKIGNRGTVGRGKAFESATYMRLGGPDLDDQAAGVRFLGQRDYIDQSRVGIYGHSYGGYMTALALLRYPDLFHVGVSGAPVTHWKNYDTIYTERYMRTPQVNSEGYEAGSCMKYASQLKGHLLVVHGLMDDNVHPSNTWQLADALYKANKRFEMLVYPGF